MVDLHHARSSLPENVPEEAAAAPVSRADTVAASEGQASDMASAMASAVAFAGVPVGACHMDLDAAVADMALDRAVASLVIGRAVTSFDAGLELSQIVEARS